MDTAHLKALSPAQKAEAAREKMRKMGVRVAPKGAWKKSLGTMKGCEHFDEAIRLGAEWRSEMNRRSLLGEDVDC